MTKINPTLINPIQAGKIAREAAILMHTAPKSEVSLVGITELEPIARSVLDLTTEELGYFKCNGRVIKTIFPR